PNVVGVIVITFVLTRALPGDPAAFFAGQAASAEAVEQIRSKLGLDKPLPQQFVLYLRDLARGDLGVSLSSGQPVAEELLTRLPASLELTLAGLAFAVAVAIPLGIAAATRPHSWVDHLCRRHHGRGVAAHLLHRAAARLRLLLPARLGAVAARAAGLAPHTVLLRYALRNALLPIITTLGMVFSFLLGSNVLVEKVFAWPGIGSFAIEALVSSDYAPVQGFVLTMAVLYVLLNL